MLQSRIALWGCAVLARRSERFGIAIEAVAVESMPAFSDLRLRRGLSTVLPRLVLGARLVAPTALLGVVAVALLIEAAEQACQIFGVLETFLDDRRSIGVGLDVFMKPAVVG